MTACRCMDGGEIAVLWWQARSSRNGGRERTNGGAVEDCWPVIDGRAEMHAANSSGDSLFVHNNLVSGPSLRRRVSSQHRDLEPPLALSRHLFFSLTAC